MHLGTEELRYSARSAGKVRKLRFKVEEIFRAVNGICMNKRNSIQRSHFSRVVIEQFTRAEKCKTLIGCERKKEKR